MTLVFLVETLKENLSLSKMLQRAGGWCEPEQRVGMIWFLSRFGERITEEMSLRTSARTGVAISGRIGISLCDPVIRPGCPVIGWDSVGSLRVISLKREVIRVVPRM